MKVHKDILYDLLWDNGDYPDYEKLEYNWVYNSRWNSLNDMIFSFRGKYYHIRYASGLTEYQEDEGFAGTEDENECYECEEIEPYEETVVIRKWKVVDVQVSDHQDN